MSTDAQRTAYSKTQSDVMFAAKVSTADIGDTETEAGAALAAAFAAREATDRVVAGKTWTVGGPYRQINIVGTSRTAHIAAGSPIGDLRLVYGNWTQSVSGTFGDVDNTNANPLPIRAAIEYPSGTVTPVFFNGSRDGSLSNGGLLTSDTVGVDIPAGATFWVRTYTNPATGDYIPEIGNSSGGSAGEGFAGSSDRTAAGSAAISQSGSYLFRPLAILGRMSGAVASVAIMGDSIAYGTGDTSAMGKASDTGGFLARALNAGGIPWTSLAVPGETGGRFYASTIGHIRRAGMLRGCSSAVVMYGTNDLQTALSPTPTFDIVSTALTNVWKMLDRQGISAWACTLGPNTTSTDSWATTGNQTVSTSRNNTVRVTVNTWIRAGAPLDPDDLTPVTVGTSGAVVIGDSEHPLAGYFETADVMESARDSGLWKAGYTSDGLHPNATGHAAMAAVIDTDQLT